MLQDFSSVFDNFGMLCIKGLIINKHNQELISNMENQEWE